MISKRLVPAAGPLADTWFCAEGGDHPGGKWYDFESKPKGSKCP